MKQIFKFLESINKKYDQLNEPYRFLVFFVPMFIFICLTYTVSILFFIPAFGFGFLRALYIHDVYKVLIIK